MKSSGLQFPRQSLLSKPKTSLSSSLGKRKKEDDPSNAEAPTKVSLPVPPQRASLVPRLQSSSCVSHPEASPTKRARSAARTGSNENEPNVSNTSAAPRSTQKASTLFSAKSATSNARARSAAAGRARSSAVAKGARNRQVSQPLKSNYGAVAASSRQSMLPATSRSLAATASKESAAARRHTSAHTTAARNAARTFRSRSEQRETATSARKKRADSSTHAVELRARDEENNALRAELEETQERLAEAQEQCSQLLSTRQWQDEALENQDGDRTQLQREFDAYKKTSKERDEKLALFRKKAREYHTYLVKARASLNEHKETLGESQKDNEKLEKKLSGFKVEVEEAEQKLRFSKKKLAQETEDKEAAEASSKKLKKQVVEGEETIEELERALKKSKASCEEADANLIESDKKWRARLVAAETEADDKVAAVRKECQQLEADAKRVGDALDAEKATTKSLESTVADRESKITQLQGLVRSHEESIQQLQNDLRTKDIKLKCEADEAARQRDIVATRDGEIAELKATIANLRETVASKEEQMRNDEKLRKELHNQVLELKGNIRVFARIRPSERVLSGEAKEDSSDGATPNKPPMFVFPPNTDNRAVNVSDPVQRSDVRGNKKSQVVSKYKLDHVFQPDSTQEDVFREVSQLIQSALDGYNVCVFAYGQTNSGKTYTMEGPTNVDSNTRGIIPRAVDKIFEEIERMKSLGWEMTISASFLEIYNEEARDLLVKSGSRSSPKKLEIRFSDEDATVANLRQEVVASPEELAPLLRRAARNRAVGSTAMNERSSRSHSVFQLTLKGKNDIEGVADRTGILSLVDLAGSENLKESKAEGVRRTETQAINKSLQSLRLLLHRLHEDNQKKKRMTKEERRRLFRDSKLLGVLHNSLGGNSKTLMFVNVSGDEKNYSETRKTLEFGKNVNQLEIGTARRQVKLAK